MTVVDSVIPNPLRRHGRNSGATVDAQAEAYDYGLRSIVHRPFTVYNPLSTAHLRSTVHYRPLNNIEVQINFVQAH